MNQLVQTNTLLENEQEAMKKSYGFEKNIFFLFEFYEFSLFLLLLK